MTLLISSGDKGIRTLDPLLARQVLSQLSYTPTKVQKTLNKITAAQINISNFRLGRYSIERR